VRRHFTRKRWNAAIKPAPLLLAAGEGLAPLVLLLAPLELTQPHTQKKSSHFTNCTPQNNKTHQQELNRTLCSTSGSARRSPSMRRSPNLKLNHAKSSHFVGISPKTLLH
jgi:hypothetical protein